MEDKYFDLVSTLKFFIVDLESKPIINAINILFRDFKKVFGCNPITETNIDKADVIVKLEEKKIKDEETYEINFKKHNDGKYKMFIIGKDVLGVIYGILFVSHEFLQVDPFWFWTDKEPERKKRVKILIKNYKSEKSYIRFRGWFVNDEVCLIGWTDKYPPPREIWHPVFETLLRCRGNLVIPGTDLPRDGIHWDLASEMGLYITHHHAEPLGAEMFARAYPDKEADYEKNQALFEKLWEEAVIKQRDIKIVWTLGFRGQGDCPFWEHGEKSYSQKKKGDIISKAILKQYEIICKYVKSPVCSTYLYGEIMELYRDGYINIPKGVIKIWSDNGYGKMVSRRQGNINLRIPSLPENSEPGPHGLYYHITFHDLQASNHLTMFPNKPNFLREELTKAFNKGVDEYLLLNCGNIRPHIYFLDIVSDLWKNGDINIEEHLNNYCIKYFSIQKNEIKKCYKDYFENTLQYGELDYDKAGDEFYHHPARRIIGHWICDDKDKAAIDLNWLAKSDKLSAQVKSIYNMLSKNLPRWKSLKKRVSEILKNNNPNQLMFFKDNFIFHIDIILNSTRGFLYLCKSYFSYLKKNYPLAFVEASKSLWEYKKCIKNFKEAEHGKWRNFYRGDWLTNIISTLYSLDSLRKFIRMHGDSPDFFLWSRDFLLSESEKRIYLENTHRKPLSDDKLAKQLDKKLSGL